MHDLPLITTIVVGLVLAFALALVAHRLKVSPLLGYLLAGVVVGPFTPGYVADQDLAHELSEIGVILLMFGVGLHFSLKDLLSVRFIAVPGAIVQIAVATLLGLGLALALGWPVGAGIVFGLALSVASTVVLLRALQERRIVDTDRGRIAVGWLIVEDIAMVFTLVLLPALSGVLNGEGGASFTAILEPIVITLAKVVAFVAIMLVVGRRLIPWLLHYVAHSGSRELFRLGVLAIALGVAYLASAGFGVSFALGAFFAGMILSESELSQRATNEVLPLRDAFAVLFFVSVGMLFDPTILVTDPLPVLATVLIIVLGKSVAAFLIVRAFGHPKGTALTISASLAQIGEFSFILAGLGVSLELMPERGQDLILAGALISILINPVLFFLLDRRAARAEARKAEAVAETAAEEAAALRPTSLTNHVILVGYGRVGSIVGAALAEAKVAALVVEADNSALAAARAAGHVVLEGNAADAAVLAATVPAAARSLLVAIPDAFEGGSVVEQARRLAPSLPIIARAHSDAESRHLAHLGATTVVMGEREIARSMIGDVLGETAKEEVPPEAPESDEGAEPEPGPKAA